MKTHTYNVHNKITKERWVKLIVVKNPQKLKEDLTREGHTITSRAEQLGYSKAYISSIITGVRNPNEKVAIGICELTGEQFDTYFFIQNVHKKITKKLLLIVINT